MERGADRKGHPPSPQRSESPRLRDIADRAQVQQLALERRERSSRTSRCRTRRRQSPSPAARPPRGSAVRTPATCTASHGRNGEVNDRIRRTAALDRHRQHVDDQRRQHPGFHRPPSSLIKHATRLRPARPGPAAPHGSAADRRSPSLGFMVTIRTCCLGVSPRLGHTEKSSLVTEEVPHSQFSISCCNMNTC